MFELPLGLIVWLVVLGVAAFWMAKSTLTRWQRVGYVCFLVLLYVAYRVSPYSSLLVYLIALAVVYAARFGIRNQTVANPAVTALRRSPAPIIALALYLAVVWIVPYRYGVVWAANGDRDQIKQNPITGQTFEYVAVNHEWVEAKPQCGQINTPPQFSSDTSYRACGDYDVEWGANPEPRYLAHTQLPISQPLPSAQSQPSSPTSISSSTETFSPTGQLVEKKFGNYSIRVYSGSDDETGMGFLEILQSGTRVYTNQHESFDTDHTGVPIGTDVTGTGSPNLVVREYSGGAHCCTSFEVFALGGTFQKLATIEAADCDGAQFQKQSIGGYAFHACDAAVRMYGAGFADSAAPEVILRYVNGSFRLAPDLMRKSHPSVEELKAKAAEVASNPTWSTEDVPGAFWRVVIDLTYSGNSGSADQFVALAWPPQRKDKSERMSEFLAQVKKSPYWEDIQTLNAR